MFVDYGFLVLFKSVKFDIGAYILDIKDVAKFFSKSIPDHWCAILDIHNFDQLGVFGRF
jgi:hypothetical protein